MIERFIEWLMFLVEGNEAEKEIDEKIKVMEKCRLDYELKKMRRK